jgi:hypothetical protein
MSDPLAAEALMRHIRALADEIGPRPPGHPAEAQARAYIRRTLAEMGYTAVEEQPFLTFDKSIYPFFFPLCLSIAGGLLGELGGRWGKASGAAMGLLAALGFWRWSGGGRQPLTRLAPQHSSANLIVRIAPRGQTQQRVVLIGHTDTQQAYPIFRPGLKQQLISIYSQTLAFMSITGLTLLARALGWRWAAPLSWGSLAMQLLFAYRSDPRPAFPYVAGANDNATAVACLLGLAGALRESPLEHTEVWLAFTGAEEVMCLGMHQLLDTHGDSLRDAWFIDFEMVGSDEIVYITRHSGLTYLNAYRPDAESLALAERTAHKHGELGLHGRDMVIVEEVGTLRQRGYRGICIAGVGPDGWLENWHLPSDISANIKPGGVERAARFGLAMLRELDGV